MLHPDPEMCSLWNTSEITCNMKLHVTSCNGKTERSDPVTDPATNICFSHRSRDERGTVLSVRTSPVGRKRDSENPFVKQPLDPFPQSGWLEWATGWMFRLGTFVPKGRRNLPQCSTSLLARGPAEAAEQRIPRTVPRSLVPSADQREEEEPDGRARGETPQAFARLLRKGSNTTYRPWFGVRSSSPLRSLTGYPTQQHICKGTTWSLENHVHEMIEVPSEPQLSNQWSYFKKSPASVGLSSKSEHPPQHTLRCTGPCSPAPPWGRGSTVWPRSTLFVVSERGDYMSGARQVPWRFKQCPETAENKLYCSHSDGKR